MKKKLFCSLLLILVVSYYESVIVVYGFAILCIMYLEIVCRNRIKDLRSMFFFSLDFLLPLVLAIGMEFVLTKVVKLLFTLITGIQLLGKGYGANELFARYGAGFSLHYFLGSIRDNYIVAALWYYPILILDVSALVLLVIFVKKTKLVGPQTIPLFLLFYLSLILLSLLQGEVSPYRVCTVFSFFVGFTFLALVIECKGDKIVVLTLGLILCLSQSLKLDDRFFIQNKAWQEEENTIHLVMDRLQADFDMTKPVVFVGEYTYSKFIQDNNYSYKEDWQTKLLDKITTTLHFPSVYSDRERTGIYKKYTQSQCNSVITHSIVAFNEPNVEMYYLLYYEGYDVVHGTNEMYEEALSYSKNMSSWPNRKSIEDKGDYIVVNFG